MTERKRTPAPPMDVYVRPDLPPSYEEQDAAAIQALMRGEANAGQQRRALDWIIMAAAGTYDQSFRGERIHDSSFAEGRRFVGNQIIKLTKLKLGKLQQRERDDGTERASPGSSEQS